MITPAGYFAEELLVRGRIEGEGDLDVAGTLEGSIQLRGCFSVAATGRALGDVRADEVDVAGVVRGDVSGTDVRIGTAGRVIGDVRATRVALEDGGVLDGAIHMDVTLPAVFDDASENDS